MTETQHCVATFDNLYLVPGHSDIESRHDIDLTPNSTDVAVFQNPIIAAPMDTVVNSEVASIMRELGGSAVLHRYASIEAQRDEFLEVPDGYQHGVFCAVGAAGDWWERFEELYAAGCRYFCVDVAHGFHKQVGLALARMSTEKSDVHLMAGNVADLNGFDFLVNHGAQYVRVGVAGGSVCETRNKTGFGLPTLESVIRCARSTTDGIIVADGGIRDSGDIVKALACGADMVMLGSMLAAHRESPGDLVEKDGVTYKVFRGMASEGAQKDWRGWVSVAEGRETLVPLKDRPLRKTVDTILRGVKSGLSYAGCRSLIGFPERCHKVFA
jgi:IMP dehydrogenase